MSYGESMDLYLNTDETKEPEACDAIWAAVPHCGICGIAIAKEPTTNVSICHKGHINRLTHGAIQH